MLDQNRFLSRGLLFMIHRGCILDVVGALQKGLLCIDLLSITKMGLLMDNKTDEQIEGQTDKDMIDDLRIGLNFKNCYLHHSQQSPLQAFLAPAKTWFIGLSLDIHTCTYKDEDKMIKVYDSSAQTNATVLMVPCKYSIQTGYLAAGQGLSVP